MKKPFVKKVLIPAAILIALAILAGAFDLFSDMGSMINITFETVVKVLVALLFLIVLRNVLLYLVEFFRTRNTRIATIANIISSMVKYATIIIGFCWILSIIGVDVSTIFASIGVIALILGFGAESLVADLVTGIFILFENEYNVGDIIEVDGFRGTVKNIGMRTISLEDGGGNIKIINNSDLKNILNRSNQGSVSVCDISIPYEVDLEQFEPVLTEILAEIKEKYPETFIGELKYNGVEELADSSVILRVVGEVEEKNIYSGRRLLNRELKIAMDKHNIANPNPQYEIYMK